jgi:hypothetical protein
MKIVAKPIDVVSWTNKSGFINPVRFRITNGEEAESVIKIDKVIIRDSEKFNGNKMYVYKCQSCINGIQKLFELKYELDTCKWMLWKI